MTSVANRVLCSSVLVVWGSLLCFLFFSGRVKAYLHPSFQPYMVVAGAALLLLAIAVLALPSPDGAPPAGHVSLEAMSIPRRIFMLLVLVAPVLGALAVSSGQYSASTVLNRGFIESIADAPNLVASLPEPPLPGEQESVPETSYLTKDADGRIVAEVIDLLYAAEEPTMLSDFEDQEVSLVGQLMPSREKNTDGNRFNLVRMFMWCCAADARPISLAVQTKERSKIPEMTWVKVTGKAAFPIEGGRRIPLIYASSVSEAKPPEEAFIY